MNLWCRQLAAVVRLELEKNFFRRRLWWFLAVWPVFLAGVHSFQAARGKWPGPNTLDGDIRFYAAFFQAYYLRLGIFFGCAGIFSNLFRGEMLEKTLHYYLLTPMRREILAVGKFVAGLVTAVFFFAGGAALSNFLLTLHFGPAHWEHLLRGPGLSQLGWYTLVAALGCVGYGALFTFLGLVFKNPTIAAFAVMVWEGINPFLPALFKKLSIIFFLKGLCPVEVPIAGPVALFGLLADPTPAWLAIPGLLLLAMGVMVFAALHVRKLEINYSE